VALKVLKVGGDGPAIFLGEAEAVAKLHHPNIVQIFEVGEGDGPPYLALEYVAGGTLRSRVEGKPQPIRAAARLVETLARAVQAAHARGLVHRDLKPGNVLIGIVDPSADEEPAEDVTAYGVAKIADFGLAMKLNRDDAWGCGHELAGTPQYMAPEQALGRGEQLGPGVDISTTSTSRRSSTGRRGRSEASSRSSGQWTRTTKRPATCSPGFWEASSSPGRPCWSAVGPSSAPPAVEPPNTHPRKIQCI